jgi:hypothetical protein
MKKIEALLVKITTKLFGKPNEVRYLAGKK